MAIPTKETYDELQQAYDFFNERIFDNSLPGCLITLQREKRTYGYYSPKRFVGRDNGEQVDEIAMNPRYFSIRTIKESLSTLVHEMCHQKQEHFGTPGRKGYHNKEFAFYMESIGLMPSDTGEVGGRKVGQSMTHYIIINGLFDKACTELITTQFRLSWMDRFPPREAKLHLPSDPSGKGHIEDESEILGYLGYEDENSVESVTSPEDEEIQSALRFVEPPSLTPENKSNRSKYTCPVCSVNLWGKPGLKILCAGEQCDHSHFVEK